MHYDLDDLNRKFAAAQKTIAPGGIAFLNQSGPDAEAILDLAREMIDPDLLQGWVGTAGGDCLFTTTFAAASLATNSNVPPFILSTGYFDIPEMAPERVIHAWLEFDTVVLNVSNPDTRPVYVMDKDVYFDLNLFGGYIQKINHKGLYIRLERWTKKHGGDIDIRDFTKLTLGKTRHAMVRQQEKLAKQ